jgi:release factor glutamine methyltransferase
VSVATRSGHAVLVAELTEVVGARHEARFIVAEATSRVGGGSTGGERDDEVATTARQLAKRRAAGEPLQYVFGHWPFRSLDLVVDPRVLIPRPETEQVVEVALATARRLVSTMGEPLVVVDAGTGSGAIALSLAHELGSACVGEIWATDASPGALAVAADNLGHLRQGSAGSVPTVHLARGDWLDPLPDRLTGAVHLVVSNPPYVSAQEWGTLEPEVRAEPRPALVAGSASDGTPGLGDVEAVLAGARRRLASGGVAVVELAPHQASAALALARGLGYSDVSIEPDLAGRPRVVVAAAGE